MAHYDVSSIVEMSQLDHLRKNSGMYVGDAETATRLLEELLDNALDEVQGGHATIVGVFVDTKNKSFKVLDNGRGFPFDQSLPLEKDPPILSATRLFTSGKFSKGSKDSVYDIAVGLHGIGLVACFALSEFMLLDIFREGTYALYKFTHDGGIDREQKSYEGKRPYSTRVEVKPSPKYFTDTGVDLKRIEERLFIAVANYPKLKIVFKIDEEEKLITGTEKDLINKYIGGENADWLEFNDSKKPETYDIRLGWDDEGSTSPKVFTTINLCKVDDGAHVNKVYNILKNYFSTQGKKNKLSFQPNDCLVNLRLYINLKILHAAFAEQVKSRLSSRSDLTVMDSLESKIEKYFQDNPDQLEALLEKFQQYRTKLTNKSIVKNTNGKTRGFTKLTKLRDCTLVGGELLIGEGDSAVGGLIKVRNPKKHAILPLRGVIPNAITKKDFHQNQELKDIIVACGCGIDNHCDVSKLRYDKIILAADADPAGHWITALLITLFAYKMTPVVKEGRLYVCETPLFGYREKKKLIPLWEDKDVENARKEGKKILRFKGLGEFDPYDLKVFTLDEGTRKLIQVKWSEENSDKLFKLMSTTEARRQLVMGEWEI